MDRGRLAPSVGFVGGRVVTVLTAALLIGAFFALSAVAQAARPPLRPPTLPLPTATMAISGVPLTVELATEPAAKRRGLGYRARLAPGTGMLFVEDAAERRTFWMKGMRFCIDIVWIEVTEVGAAAVRGAQIAGAAESVCPDPPGTADAERARYTSPAPVRYVLEVPAGRLKAHDLGVGAPVRIPEEVWTP